MNSSDQGDRRQMAKTWADATPLHIHVARQAAELAKTIEFPGIQLVRDPNDADIRRAIEATRNELVKGTLIALGRRPESRRIEEVIDTFWVGASVEPDSDEVVHGDERWLDVRLVADEREAGMRPVASEAEPSPGRPSKKNVIREAIAEYASSNGDPELSRQSVRSRYRAYRAYISNRGFDPQSEDGFKDKTFQKYETEFRRKNR
jgi:hypothetical protein